MGPGAERLAPPAAAPAASRPGAVLVLLLLLAVIAAARLRTYHEPLERDLTTYAVIGRELLHGRTLYDDLWDHKPPAIHAVYALATAVAGPGPGAVYLLNLAGNAVVLAGLWLAGTAPGRAGSRAGLWAAAFWTAVSGDLALQANQPNTELFQNGALTLAFAALLHAGAGARRPLVLAGLLLAVATLFKTTALAAVLLLAAGHVASPPEGMSRRRALPDALLIGALVGAVWAAVTGWFAVSGRGADFTAAVWEYNRAYAGNLSWNLLRGLAPRHLLPASMVSVAPLAAAVIFLGLYRARKALRAGLLSRPAILLVAWIAATFVAVSAPGQFWPHYRQLWLPPLVIAAAWATHAAGTVVPSLVLGLLVALQAPSYRLDPSEWSRRKYGDVFIAADRLGASLGHQLAAGRTFYAWGREPNLYLASGCRPPSGVLYVQPLLDGPLRDRLSKRVVADLERTPPDLVVVSTDVPAPAAHPVVAWFEARYVASPLAASDLESASPYRLLVRKDLAAPAAAERQR